MSDLLADLHRRVAARNGSLFDFGLTVPTPQLAALLRIEAAARALIDGVKLPEDEFEAAWIALEDAVAEARREARS